MLKNYFSFIENLFKSLTTSNVENISFSDYLLAIGYGVGTLLLVSLFIVLLVILAYVPLYGRKILLKNDIEAMKELTAYETKMEWEDYLAKYNVLNKKMLKKNIVFFSALIIIYLPIAIPTILFVIDKVISIII